MTRPCRETEAWLGQPASALSEAQRLSLEQHLGECRECHALHAMSRAVSTAVLGAHGELGTAARERAIASALASLGGAPSVRPGPWWQRRSVVAALAVAAGLLVAVTVTWRRGDELAWVEGAGERSFAHARVSSSRDAQLRFDAASSTLTLARGALEIEVDPRPHAPFAVQTASFRALVLGTSFHVDPERVIVRHGHVRVERAGRTVADLHAGERYETTPRPKQSAPAVHQPAAASSAASAAAPEPPASAAPDDLPATRRARRERRKLEPAGREVDGAPPASATLAEARAALAHDRIPEAQRLLALAEAAARAPSEHAEAGTLRAEIALRSNDRAGAIAAYLAVADHHERLASGENALFAAAQLSTAQAARTLFTRYLERYPSGRFAAQARARLQASSP